MRRTIALLVGIAFCAVCPIAYAAYSLALEGKWPKSWPKELEPLRKQATTLVGPEVEQWFYLIPFTKREEFVSAWPHLLKVKSKGAPIILVRGPKTDFMAIKPAGVLIHTPARGTPHPEQPLADFPAGNVRARWMWTTYIELVVDGKVVDLNRIPLPEDTPIIDERFKDEQKKSQFLDILPVPGIHEVR